MGEDKNKIIAEWLGWKNNRYGFFTPPGLDPNSATYPCIPRFTTSDADAISLLPVLVEKGYSPCLHYDLGGKWCQEIYYDGDYVVGCSKPSISEAMTSAILELIEKGA